MFMAMWFGRFWRSGGENVLGQRRLTEMRENPEEPLETAY
jgi:hypothetical protein